MIENLKKFIYEKRILILCILVFIFTLIIRIAAINMKQDMFVDEMFTTQIANYNQYYWGTSVPIEPNIHLNGYELKQKLLALTPSLKDTISDIANLHQYTRDTPHSNLYYSLYRLWFNGWGEFNLKKFIVHGATLNLIFFTISFIYLYKILKKLFKNETALIPFGLFTAFASTAAITNTTFIRPYALQEMFFLILTYTFIRYWEHIGNTEHTYKIINVFSTGLIIALTFLTGYYSSFLILMYAVLLLARAIRLKNYDALRFMITTAITAGYLIFLIYPGVCFVLFSYRAKEAYNNSFTLGNFKVFLMYTPLIIIRYFLCLPLIIIIMAYFNKIRKEKVFTSYSKLVNIILVISIIWAILILYLCPYKNIRYIMSITPLLMLIFPLIAANLKKKNIFIPLIITIFLLNIFIALSEFIGLNFRKYIPFPAKIEFMKNFHQNKFIFLEDKTLPVLIIQDAMQSPVHVYTQLADNQVYYTSNGTPKNIPFNHFYTIRNLRDTAYNTEELPKNFKRIKYAENCADDYICEEYIKN